MWISSARNTIADLLPGRGTRRLFTRALQAYRRRASRGGALLFCGLLYLTGPLQASQPCRPCSEPLQAVERVVDGDTLVLENGEKVRLIGINTPELGHWGDPDEPGARSARDALERLVHASGGRLRVCPGAEARDRYGRLLAHLTDRQGDDVVNKLLRAGQGYVIAFPPNLGSVDCHLASEAQAREAGLGVWHRPVTDARSLHGDERGFHYLQGRVERVGKSRRSIWLNLTGGLALRIARKDWKYFDFDDPRALQGRRLEVRGWITRNDHAQQMSVHHPSAIRWMD
ncbi:MAG: thermonuclease family protein [Candidatus Thiodiazotropha sp.]